MFDIPDSNIEKVYIDKDVVMGKKKPDYHYSETSTNDEASPQTNDEEVIGKVESSLWPWTPNYIQLTFLLLNTIIIV